MVEGVNLKRKHEDEKGKIKTPGPNRAYERMLKNAGNMGYQTIGTATNNSPRWEGDQER